MKASASCYSLIFSLMLVVTGWTQGNDPSMRTYNGIDGWNPCSNEQWFVDHRGGQLGDFFVSPFLKTTGIGPGAPEENFKEVCNESQTLKPDWELFDRALLSDDRLATIPGYPSATLAKLGAYSGETSKVVPAPYFALYKKSSGLLRVFFWINGGIENHEGQSIAIESQFRNTSYAATNASELYQLHGYAMSDLVNGYTFATAYNQSIQYPISAGIQVFPRTSSSSFWMVVDKYLSYDPWTNDAFGNPKEIDIDFDMKSVKLSEIELKGTIEEQVKSDIKGGIGFFNEYPFLANAVQGGVKYGQNALDKKIGTIIKRAPNRKPEEVVGTNTTVEADNTEDVLYKLDQQLLEWEYYRPEFDVASTSSTGAGALSKPVVLSKSDFVNDVIESGMNMALPQGTNWIAGAIIDGLLGTTIRNKVDVVSLNGSITTYFPLGTTVLTISPTYPNEKNRPYYFRKNGDGTPAHRNNIGLFTFLAPPKLHVTAAVSKKWGLSSNQAAETTQLDHYVTLDDPTCDIAINPEANVDLKYIKALPVWRMKKGDSWSDWSPISSTEPMRVEHWVRKNIKTDKSVRNAKGELISGVGELIPIESEQIGVLLVVQFLERKTGELVTQQMVFKPELDYKYVQDNYFTAANMPARATCTDNGEWHRGYSRDYKVTTGKSRNGDGTDGAVKLTLYGCGGYEETVPLSYQGANPFETGREAAFNSTSPVSMHPLRKVRVHLTNKGDNPEWLLSNLEIIESNLSTGIRHIVLPGMKDSQWLGKIGSIADKDGWFFDIEPTNATATCAEDATIQGNSGLATYSLEVSTQNISIAGVDAPLEIEVCGKVALKTETGYDAGEEKCWNETFQKKLMPNTTETFTTEKVHFASLTSLRVKLEPLFYPFKGKGWLAKDIVVKQNAQGATSSQTFAIRRWLEEGEEVTRMAGVGTALEFTVTTDPMSGSGSNANVSAYLVGAKGSESFWWDNKGYNDFESKDPSVFLFYSEKTLGSLQTLRLSRDDEGKRPEWLVGEVNLKTIDLSLGIENNDNFIFHEWLYSYGLYDIGRTWARTEDLKFVDNEGKTRILGKKNGYSSYRNANADAKVNLTVSTSDMKSNYGTNQLSQVIAIDGAEQKHYLIPQNLADDGFAAGSHQTFTTYREIIGGVKSVRILTKKTDDWMLLSTNIQINGANGCFLGWNGQLLSTTNPNVKVADEEFFDDGSYIYLEQACPNATAEVPKISALKKSSSTIQVGENLELTGKGLDRNADDWQASLGSMAISVTGAVYNRLSLDIPAVMRSGTYALKVINATSGIDWTQNVQLENPAPVLTSISHSVRKPGDVLEFKGTNFGAFSDAIAVKIGGKDAPLLRVLEDRISVRVPDLAPGVYTVPVTVFGKASAQVYSVTIEAVYPEITGLSPRTTLPGKTVMVYGAHFGSDVSLVKVYLGVNVLDPLTVTSSKLTFKVPDDMAYGDYKVQVSLRGYKAKTSLDLTLGGPPEVFSFDNPDFTWTCDEATVIRDVSVTNGSPASMALAGEGYRVARSPRFITDLLGEYSDTIAVDVFIPSGLSNPYWAGEIAMFLDLPAAGLNNSWLGNQQLTGLSTGAWHTLRFALNDGQLAALAGDYPGLQVALVLNAASADSYYRFDNLRFVGSNKVFRTARHVVGSRLLNILVPDVLGFESSSPWTAEPAIPLQFVTDPRVQGEHALQAKASGYVHLGSLPVRSWEWKAATSLLNLELYIPDPAPNPWWVGNVSVSLSCPEDGIYNRNLGQKDLTHLFRMEYNSIQIPLAAGLVTQLQGLTGSCQVFVDLNVAGGSAPFVLDKMGFVANAGATLPEAPSSSSVGNSSSSSASASTGAAFQCVGMCAGAVVVSSAQQNFTLGTTGEVWYVLDRIPGGWQGSEMAGRTVEVNGVAVALGSKAWPAATSGKWYVRFSPGNHSWASWSWWL